MDYNEQILSLQSELAKAKAEVEELRAKLDAQNKGFDVQAALDRIKAKNESDAAYKAEMEATFARQRNNDNKPSEPHLPRYY